MKFAVAGIHTGIGKTVCSAAIAEALQADYWKPVQAGELENSDSIRVQRMLSNSRSRVHTERYRLLEPMSPHAAAAREGISIDFSDFIMPQTDNHLLIETAGGLLSPINHHGTMADLITHLQLPVILVSRAYLGSINHTLLCLEVLRHRQIPLLGVVWSGTRNEESEAFVRKYIGDFKECFVPEISEESREQISAAAVSISPAIHEMLA